MTAVPCSKYILTQITTKNITVSAAVYDNITTSTYAGMPGETISIKVAPAPGYVLQPGSLKYNDGTSDHTVNGTGFTMPNNAITISAVFTDKTISIAGQTGVLTAGTAGIATFTATTANVTDDTAVSVSWCDAGGSPTDTPTGLSANGTNVASNGSTITVLADTPAAAGTYYFKATSDGAASNVVTVTVSSNFGYSDNGDGACTITGYGGPSGDVTIPSTINGLTVTAIGSLAFESCYALTGLTISSGVTSIGNGAFIDCINLTSVTVDAGNLNYSSLDGVLYNKDKSRLVYFPGGLTGSFSIPSSVKSIEEGAFESCKLTSVMLPANLTSIGGFAFCGCTSLTGSITIPASVTSIVRNAFNGCNKLTGINVDTDNQNYSSMYGILYDKDQADLLFCPLGLTSVTIPYGVTSIANNAFYECSGFTSVTIPASVTSIGSYAFCNCSKLASVYFDGAPTMNHGLDTFSGCSESLTFFCPIGNTGISLTPLTQLDTKPITVAVAVYDCITPSTYLGMPGETISLKIKPAAGYVLKTGSLKYNDGSDHAISGTSFTMPDANVTVSAEFAIPPVTIAVTGVTLNKTSTSIEKGSSETLTATVAPADATNKSVTWSSDQPGIASVDQTGKVTAVAAGTATITVSTADGNKTAACQVTVTESATTVNAGIDQTIPISGPTNITVPQGVTGTKIDIDPANPLPLIKVNASTPLGTIQTEIPAGTTVSGPAGWNGEITLPTVKASPSVTITGARTIDTVIEVGLGNDTIIFSKAVRLLIPNMAGKSAGFIRNGSFTPITATISPDSQNTADAEIPDGGEAKINVLNDLVIWTKHFTEFVAYTSAASSSGGVDNTPQYATSTTGSASVYPSAGGKVGLGSDAIVEIPANALQGTSGVTVKVQKVESPGSIPAGFKQGSDVFEFSVDSKTSYSFNKPITITLKLNTTAGSSPAIYYYDSQSSKWIKVGGTVSGSTINVSVDHFTKYTVLAENQTQPTAATQQISYTDLDKHWAKQFVEKLAGLGAVSGYPDGSFKPDAPITRAEFVTILVKALKLTSSGNGPVFKDTAGHWASADISIAAESGLISGYGDNCFKPDSMITREEMAVIAVKAIKLQQADGETSFTDNAMISPWAKGSMKAIVNNNIMTGFPDNTIRSQGNTTRAEAVTVIVKLVK